MTGIDTNVLVRMIIDDPGAPQQCAAALRLEQSAVESGQTFMLDTLVLVETIWVLRRAYRVDRTHCLKLLRKLQEARHFAFDEADIVAEAMALFADKSSGFADCVLAARQRKCGVTTIFSFDRAATALPGFRLLRI